MLHLFLTGAPRGTPGPPWAKLQLRSAEADAVHVVGPHLGVDEGPQAGGARHLTTAAPTPQKIIHTKIAAKLKTQPVGKRTGDNVPSHRGSSADVKTHPGVRRAARDAAHHVHCAGGQLCRYCLGLRCDIHCVEIGHHDDVIRDFEVIPCVDRNVLKL